jgi:hypothetical protein
LEEETTNRQTKKTTVSISKEAGASRCKKGGPALPELGRQHACRDEENQIAGPGSLGFGGFAIAARLEKPR